MTVFHSGLYTEVKGFTAREATMKYAPEGSEVATITVGVGGGSDRFPVMWVGIPVWETLAVKVMEKVDRKGIRISAVGMLQIRLYEREDGKGKAVGIELKNVREVKIYDREGELVEVLTADKD